MRKYVLSASLLTMLASSALAEEALQYRDCRQSEGRLGWFAVSYTINDGKRTEKSAQDLNKACTRVDYEDSRQVAKSWGEKLPPLQGQSTDNQRRDTNDTRDDTSNGRQSRDDTSDRRGSRSGSDSGGGRDFGGSRDLGSGRDLGSRGTLGSRGGDTNVATNTQSAEGAQNRRPGSRGGGRRKNGSSFGSGASHYGSHYGSSGRFYGSNRRFYGSSGRFYGSSGRFYGNRGRFYGGMRMGGYGYRRFR